jgi:hypothetical protein
MTKQLYEEALADVKKLKEVAEDNAKRAILEAVTPRIRDLIENQLLGEEAPIGNNEMPVEDEDELLVDDMMEPAPSSEPGDIEMPMLSASPGAGDSNTVAAAISMPDEEGKVTLDLSALQSGVDNSEEKEYELNFETVQALGALLVSKGNSVNNLQNEVHKIVKATNALRRANSIVKESSGYGATLSSTLNEVAKLSNLVSSRLRGRDRKLFESTLKKCYITLKDLMEQNNMRLNRRRLVNEADVTLKLTGLPDDVNLDDVGIDLITGDEGGDEEGGDEDLDLGGDEDEESEGGDEEGDDDLDLGGDEGEDEEGGDDLDLDLGDEEGGDDEGEDEEVEESAMSQYGESRRLRNNVIVEIDEGMLRREISRMKSLREEAETKAQSWGNGPGDVSDDFEDDDMGDPFVDIELTTESDRADELDETEKDDDNDGEDPNAKKAEGVQESRIRRAIARERRIQTEAKKKAQSAKKNQQVAEKQKRNGKTTQAAVKQANKKVRQMKEAYAFYARKYNASVLRENNLKGMLVEARSRKAALFNEGAVRSAGETSNLRAKLTETNLFNAKLLFTNKLLQNESLTKRQKAQIIERLDEARSEREVKLVYESVVKTLQGPTRQLSESAAPRTVLGSASRATRPAATLNESFEVDRWARLAGIK